MTRPEILFYCQHLLGVGHISRSLAICEGLLARFDVVFVQGGPDIGRTLDHPGFSHVFLPPLLMREGDSSLYDPGGKSSVEDVWSARRDALAALVGRPFAAAIIELFPFGRYKFKGEILGLIGNLRRANPECQIYCSNRDIMVQKADQAGREAKIVGILTEHFDHVLVHSDPALIPLERTFGAADRIRHMTQHTGYVTGGAGEIPAADGREARILVSLGGGALGPELALACARVAGELRDYEMRILTGPYTSAEVLGELEELAEGAGNLSIHGFSDNFREELSCAALSISLGGYNTTMDILATRTPALIYPYRADIEQSMRAEALRDKGILDVLAPDQLSGALLVSTIRTQLEKPVPAFDVDLSGAQTTAEILTRHLAT